MVDERQDIRRRLDQQVAELAEQVAELAERHVRLEQLVAGLTVRVE